VRLPILGLAIVLTIASVSVIAWGQVTAPENPKTPWQEVVVAVTDQPDEHFHKAREDFLKGDKKDAAMEVREAAEFFRLEASYAAGKEKTSLSTSFRELEKLARALEDGSAISIKELDRGFSQTEYGMARHQYKKASEYASKKEFKKAGHALKGAALNLEHAAKRAGLKLEAEALAAIEDARRVGGKLVEGAGSAPSEFEWAARHLGEEMEKVGKKLEPGRG
jgi:hypothetical protein